MKQLILYGRGGQGVVTASKIIAVAAAVYDGGFAQALPAFTAERRGAPVYAYVRMSDSPIDLKSFVYRPDVILVFDSGCLGWAWIFSGDYPRDGGRREFRRQAFPLGTPGPVRHCGCSRRQPVWRGPNVAMVAAFARATGWITLDATIKALYDVFGEEGGRRNEQLAREAFEATDIA